MQPRGFFVARLTLSKGGLAAPGRRGRLDVVRRRRGHRRHGPLLSNLLGNTPNHRMLTVDHGADGITEIAQQVPAVGRSDRIRRALAHAIRIGAGPVACDDLDTWMVAQPPGQGLGLPVRQEVDHRVALQVDQDGPVATAAAPCPVIDGQDARRGRRPIVVASLACHAQQRVRADRHRQPLGQTLAGLAAERQSQAALQAAQALGPPCGGWCNTGQALGEGLAGAGRIKAAEASRLDAQQRRAALPRQIAQEPLVVAVDAARDRAAAGARGRRGLRLVTMVTRSGVGRTCTTARPVGIRHKECLGKAGFQKGSPFLLCVHPSPKRQHGNCGRSSIQAALT